jgi:hypothetical protein
MADPLSLRSERIVKFLLRTGTATIEEFLAEASRRSWFFRTQYPS